MNTNALFYTLVIITAFTLANCNPKTTNVTDNTTTEPIKNGTTTDSTNAIPSGKWYVTNYPLNGKPFAPAQFYVINFDKKSLGVHLEKNQCGTDYSITKTAINFGKGFSCTEMCCDSKEGLSLLELLKGELKYSTSSNSLIINTSQGNIILKNDLGTLFSSQWKAISYADRKEGTHIKFGKEYILQFEAARVNLRLDANNCHTTCTYNDKESSFELPANAMACTKKCCDSEDGLLLMNSLQAKITYKKDQNNLVLKTFNKEIIFEPYGND